MGDNIKSVCVYIYIYIYEGSKFIFKNFSNK